MAVLFEGAFRLARNRHEDILKLADQVRNVGQVTEDRDFIAANLVTASARVHELEMLLTKRDADAASAAIRIRYINMNSGSLVATNTGVAEANGIILRPISFASFPWVARSREIGSLTRSSEEVLPLIVERGDGQCYDCSRQGKPSTLNAFLLIAGDHLEHELRPKGVSMNKLCM